jgi:HEPN domain-containing protein
MPHDPELVAETQAWLRKADQDLAAGAHALAAEPPFTAHAVFHAQQAAEKSMKALLTWHSTPFRKTHLLEEIGEQCLRIDDSLRPWVDDAVPLTAFAWKYRYPGEPDEPSEEEAANALAIARRLYDAVLARLPDEVRP